MVNYSLNKTSIFLSGIKQRHLKKKRNWWSNALMQSMILALMHNILAKRVNEHYNGEIWREISITRKWFQVKEQRKKRKKGHQLLSLFKVKVLQ